MTKTVRREMHQSASRTPSPKGIRGQFFYWISGLYGFFKAIISPKATGLLFACCFCFFSLPSSAQNPFADSLLLVLSTTPEDSNKIILLNDLAWEYKFENPDSARQYLAQSIALAQQIKFQKGEAQAHNNLGVVEAIAENLELAEKHYQKALELRLALGDKKGVASLYNNIGNLKESLGDGPGALINLKKSLKVREELADTIRIARVNYGLALVQESMGNYLEALDYLLKHLALSERLEDHYEIANAQNLLGNIKSELERYEEALEHHQQALKLRIALEDQLDIAQAYNNLANSLDDLGEKSLDSIHLYPQAKKLFAEALDNYQQSLKVYQQEEDQEGISQAFNNIGLIYKNLGTYFEKTNKADSSRQSLDIALDWLNQSLELRQTVSDEKGIMEIYNGIGDVMRRQKKWKEALLFTQKYYDIAETFGDNKYIQKAFKDFSRAYEGMGNYKKAFAYRKKYDEWRYARLDEQRAIQNSRRESIYGDDQKQFAIEQQEKELELQSAQLERATLQRRALLGGALGLFLLVGLLYNRYRLKTKANKNLAEKNSIIEKERERSEALLLNILPAETAEELKANGRAEARYYESVTVLFTDFKSFTTLAEQMTPKALVAELDECFRAFDEITSLHGIEKIKTIGDAYMCAGGIPVSNNSHAADVVAAGLEIQAFMETYRHQKKSQGQKGFEARVGIHTGPVVAGIVGSKKFAYDIWGDTVNTAARMESSGEVGEVNISQSTFLLVKDQYHCISRGKIAAKNKGAIDMYFVEKRSE